MKKKHSRAIIFLLFFVLFLFVVGLNTIFTRMFQEKINTLSHSIGVSMQELVTAIELDTLAQEIKYYDEVLTQSARNYAFTQQERWKNRYRSTEPLLDDDIKAAVNSGTDFDVGIFSQVDEANLALVDLENQSIALVDEGKSEEALAILEGTEYKDYKRLYSQGLNLYLQTKSQENVRAFNGLAKSVESEAQKLENSISYFVSFISLYSGIFITLAGLLFLFTYFFFGSKGR